MTVEAAPAKRRVFLFLQGPSSAVFRKTAEHLEAAGHVCLRVNLNAGDWLFWRRAGGLNYRGSFSGWPAYVDQLFISRGITDLVLLGEERPYHRVAVDTAKRRGVDVTVIEMGYLRPDWITVERDGMSSNSRFPDDPDRIRKAARGLPPISMQTLYRQDFLTEALLDLAYNLPNVFASFVFPAYRRHALFHPLHEYVGWIFRLAKTRHRKAQALALGQKVLQSRRPFFVYPLQLETDYQLRSHSPYRSQRDAIDEVITSFAMNAPPVSDLVIKLHPLDNGLIDWSDVIEHSAKKLVISERVHFIDGGNLEALIQSCAGMVTVNSTAVLGGLRSRVPVKVLGCAIYDLKGMTHQGSLDTFWSAPEVPDGALVDDFFSLLAASIHVRGNFYSRFGSDAAAKAIAERLDTNTVNAHGADCGFAPRQKPLKKVGVHAMAAW